EQFFRASFQRPTSPDQRPTFIPARTEKGLQELVNDSQDPSILRIPEMAYLFRDKGNGQYEALVDVFAYKSGDFRNPW
ncbi:MAG: hypothetical protein MN733_22750, partial [Nitrososphaera sp.]|nr:hypothetical protein [Nitrososphaera sp.]